MPDISHTGTRDPLLKEAELTLNQALDMCRSQEVARQQLDTLCKDEGDNPINFLSRRFKQERHNTQNRTTAATAAQCIRRAGKAVQNLEQYIEDVESAVTLKKCFVKQYV